jgi:riboflavin kinase/FMN adenylyltransferase
MAEFQKPSIPVEFRESKAVTLGVFDGVHLGHRQILSRLKELDPDHGLVITFRNHPDEFLFGRQVKWICSHEERLQLLKDAGASHVLEWPFDDALKSISAEDFVKSYFIEELNRPHVVMGYDLRFGSQAQGNYEFLKKNYEDVLELSRLEACHFEREVISSSRIRETILSGDLARVEKMLGRPLKTTGVVVEGFKRGRRLGFPTANIRPLKDILLPPHGVYAVEIRGLEKPQRGVANLGLRPTFVDDDSPLLEVHLLDFDGDLYGKKISILWERFIRPEKRFSGAEELVKQINLDIKEVRRGG